MRYRKKPVVIEAFRFGIDVVPGWFWSQLSGEQLALYRELPSCDIKTLEGTMRADRGDFIIQGVKGELYPCKPDIFEATYEPVE